MCTPPSRAAPPRPRSPIAGATGAVRHDPSVTERQRAEALNAIAVALAHGTTKLSAAPDHS